MTKVWEDALIKEFMWAMQYIDKAAISKNSQKRARTAVAKMQAATLRMAQEASHD